MIAEKNTWFAAHSDSVFHFGFAEAGTHIDTGQPTLRLFDTEEELAIYLGQVTGDPSYYENQQPQNNDTDSN